MFFTTSYISLSIACFVFLEVCSLLVVIKTVALLMIVYFPCGQNRISALESGCLWMPHLKPVVVSGKRCGVWISSRVEGSVLSCMHVRKLSVTQLSLLSFCFCVEICQTCLFTFKCQEGLTKEFNSQLVKNWNFKKKKIHTISSVLWHLIRHWIRRAEILLENRLTFQSWADSVACSVASDT